MVADVLQKANMTSSAITWTASPSALFGYSSELLQDGNACWDGNTRIAPAASEPGDVARDARYARLQEIEKPYGRALELLDRASALDARGFADEDRPPLYGVSAIARVNAIRTARLALAGDGERASASLLATLRLSRVSTFPLRSAQDRFDVH